MRAGAIDAGACQSKNGTGACHEAAVGGQGDGGLHHDVSSPSDVAIGIPSKAATFLRNNPLGGVPIRLVQDVPQRLRAPLEVAEDALPVALFIIRRAGIDV